jgi:hypothetical protein
MQMRKVVCNVNFKGQMHLQLIGMLDLLIYTYVLGSYVQLQVSNCILHP